MNTELRSRLREQAAKAKEASRRLRQIQADAKNAALESIARALLEHRPDILAANARDLSRYDAGGMGTAVLRSRLVLTDEKIEQIARGVRAVASLSDPVGSVVEMKRMPNGLRVGTMRIPIGVLCCMYESRPNVTVDIAALALKSGNACILRGGKEAIETNRVLTEIVGRAAGAAGVPVDFLQFVDTTDHEAVPALAEMSEFIDLIIPRGGEELIDAVSRSARMPVLSHRKGVTHLYIDDSADVESAIRIAVNAKVSNPSVCNSLEKVLVAQSIAGACLPQLVAALRKKGVEVRGCDRTRGIVPDVTPATESDWGTEYLDLVLAIKIVGSIEEAIEHIERYGTHLADGIVTENYTRAWQFLSGVDSAATLVNASTRFTDGGEFGLGAEIGINTTKLHGMGPMGLEALTVTKYIVFGEGQIRE